MKSYGFALILLGLFALGACTSTGPVEKYDARYIDRPYTLPKGVAAWEAVALAGQIRTNYGHATENFWPIPFPLIWEQSLSDTWTLTWAPLPSMIRHEFLHNDTQSWGAAFSFLNLGHGSNTGTVYAPEIGVFNRSKLSRDLAIESAADFATKFHSRGENRVGFEGGLKSGPVFQVSSSVALQPYLAIRVKKSAGPMVTNLSLTNGASYYNVSDDSAKVTLPVGLWVTYRVSAQWEMSGNYTHYGLERSGQEEGDLLALLISNYF